MSQHDRRKVDDQTPSGQFNGEEIEFAPFMFDASSQPADNPTSNIGFADTSQLGVVDMEFEPFMFDQGEALGTLDRPKKASGPLSQLPAPPVPAPVQAVASPELEQTTSTESPPSTPFLPSQPEISGEQTAADTSAPAPFAGHEVPMPSYLMPATPSDSAAEPSLAAAEITPLPEWFGGNAPSTGPIAQEAPQAAESRTSTEPLPATGPLATQPGLTSDPAPAPAAPAPSIFSGMAGRTRGNTGPLSTTVPNGSWSDHSLASIEDFSSVLIAMHAGKRLRQSGPLSEGMLSQMAAPNATGPATSVATEVSPAQTPPPSTSPSATPSEADRHVSESAFPDWAAQAVAGMAGSSAAHASQTEQTSHETTEGAAAWPNQPWEPQLPSNSGPMWAGLVQPQTAMPEGQPLPSWNTGQAAEPPEAASWTAAQTETATPPPASEPPAPSTAPVRPPVPTSGIADAPKTGLAAIRGVSVGQSTLDQSSIDKVLGNLEPGVADFLKSMGPGLSEAGVGGGDLEFESFMFNQGVPAPLPVLPSIDPAAMANLPQDMGPTFDPTLYSNPDFEETHEYGDIESADSSNSFAADTQPASARGPLPFWLQDPSLTAQAGVEPGPQPQQNAGQPATKGAPASEGNDVDFADLPPIEPFDFSTIGGGEEDEAFGFNTEELSGLVPDARDPMVVTANLEALADLMGGHPTSVPDARILQQAGLGNVEMISPPAHVPMQPASKPSYWPDVPSSPEPDAADAMQAEDDMTGVTGMQEPESTAGGWMATVTTNLASDPIAALAGNLDTQASNAETAIEDLDVAPFDYGELDLEEAGESPTGLLESGGTASAPGTAKLDSMDQPSSEHKTGPASIEDVWSAADGDTSLFMPLPSSTEIEEAEMPTGYLREESAPAVAEASVASPWDQSSDMAAHAGTPHITGQLSEGDGVPGLAMHGPATTAHAPADVASPDFVPSPDMVDEAAPPWLMDAGSPEDAEADEQAFPVFKARVASGPWGDYVSTSEQAPESISEPEPAPEAEPEPKPQPRDELTRDGVSLRKAAPTKTLVDPDSVAGQGPWEALAASATAGAGPQEAGSQVEFGEEFTPKMPSPGDITASGPLPSLEGFDDLNAWIERYPQDMGAHLALASAYTQAGEIDTALRIYRRMLRKSYVSDNVLRMVQDELADLEDLAHQYPRYYQVRGDLLVRQGQRTDAIDEYNKLG